MTPPLRRILLTGGSGQVGSALRALAWPVGVELLAPTRAELDLADSGCVRRWLAAAPPLAAILNAGAYTAVDRAESEPAAAWAANAVAPALLAAAARDLGVPMLHLSTDYVFGAASPGGRPREEDDPVGPLNVYGASKAAGEIAVRTSGARHAIVRTSWVISGSGQNFVRTMLRLGAERSELNVVNDQHGAPTSAHDLAPVLQAILLRHLDDPFHEGGLLHAANAGATTWHGVAARAFAAAARAGRPAPHLNAISTAEYPTPARRPADSRLSTKRLASLYGLRLRPWQDAVDDVVARLLGAEALSLAAPAPSTRIQGQS